MGAAQGAAQDQKEREDEERMLRALAKAEKEANEAQRRKEETHKRRVDDMLKTLDHQMAEKTEILRQEKQAQERQAILWAKQAEEAEEKEQEKMRKLRRERKSMDNYLVEQMQFQVGMHPEHRVNPKQVPNEFKYNGPLMRRIANDAEAQATTEMNSVAERMQRITKLGGGTAEITPLTKEQALSLPEKRRLIS